MQFRKILKIKGTSITFKAKKHGDASGQKKNKS